MTPQIREDLIVQAAIVAAHAPIDLRRPKVQIPREVVQKIRMLLEQSGIEWRNLVKDRIRLEEKREREQEERMERDREERRERFAQRA
jgi:hypothetical protein